MSRDRTWRAQGDGPFDEVVMDGDIHVEKMEARSWYVALGLQSAGRVTMHASFRADGTLFWLWAEITDDAGKTREVTLVDAPQRRRGGKA